MDGAGGDDGIKYVYIAAAEEIERRIKDGTWPYGTKLPGRAALASELGVSEMSGRHAVDILADPERPGGPLLKKLPSAGVWVIWRDEGEPGREQTGNSALLRSHPQPPLATPENAAQSTTGDYAPDHGIA